MKKTIRFTASLFTAVLVGLAAVSWAQAAETEAKPTAAQTTEGVVQTGKDVVHGAGEAMTEVAGTVKAGGTTVVDQGRGLWQGVAVPMFSQMANAVPSILKATLLLLAFWIIAILVGAGVTTLPGMTRLDEWAGRDGGMQIFLSRGEGKPRSLAHLAGRAITLK